MNLSRCLCFFLCLALLSAMPSEARTTRNSKTVRKEQRETARRMEQTRGKLRSNEGEIRRNLARYETLGAEIADADSKIVAISHKVDSVGARARNMADSVDATRTRVETLRNSYAESLRSIRRQRQLSSSTAFIFSSSSFAEARKRLRYLRELSRWEVEKSTNLKKEMAVLEHRKAELDSTRTRLRYSLRQLEGQKKRLVDARTESDLLVGKLKRQGRQLENVLAQQQAKARRLDEELNRIIEEEARQAAEAERKRLAAEKAAREAEARRRAEEQKKAAAEQKKGKSKKTPVRKEEPAVVKETPKKATAESKPKLTAPAARSFAEARGKLPMPVSGPAVIVSDFGRHTHKDFSKVEVQNNGIDIETVAGASAEAVFPGVVSMIISMDGYHNVVLVRHGEYITVYAGLASLSVRKGQEVQAGQKLGLLFSDPAYDGRTRLHFEVRHEKQKLNPAEWLR